MQKLENNIFSETFHLHSYEVGMNTKLLPSSLFNYLLHCAWAHANTSEYSYDELRDKGNFWVLSRFKANIYELPSWGEEITVNTWGKGTDRLFAIRDYEVTRNGNERFAEATSAWLVVNKTNMRPQRVNELERKFNSHADKHGINEKLDKLPVVEMNGTGELYKIHYSDIDVNNHLTSAKYLQLMFDSFDKEVITTKQLKSFELNFMAEAHLDETISILHGSSEGFLYCTLLRTDDNIEICKGRFLFA